MRRLIRALAAIIGYGTLLLVALAVLALGLRFLQIRFFYTPLPEPHAVQKADYLAGLPAVDPERAPNFVIILFDDLGWGDLSSYGSALIRTPRIDAIAAEGVRLTDFYSASPVCTPSRAALLTGRFPPRTRTDRHVFFPDDSLIGIARKMLGAANELPRDEISIAEVLRAGGYRTGMIGKWHLGERDGHRPLDFGFEEWFGVLFSNDMQPLDLWRGDAVAELDTTTRQPLGSYRHEDAEIAERGTDQSRLTERYTQEAVDFIERHADEPFLLYVAHTFPHVPHFASPGHVGLSPGGLYGDVVEDLDRSTGAIVDAIDRMRLSANTIVFVTSDNGADYNGSPGGLRGRKGDITEGGQRVPMIVRWPGRIPLGAVSAEMAMSTDLFPTLLALADLPLPRDRVIDGLDIAPMLEGRTGSPHRALYYFPVFDSLPGAVRSARFKYLLSTGDQGRDRPHLSRIDGDAEAHELSRLHPAEARSLAEALQSKRREVAENPRGWLD